MPMLPSDATVYDVPAPWDELGTRQLVYLRHRLAQEGHYAIAAHYGVSQAAVRLALGRACRRFLCRTEADLLVLAERDGVRALPLSAETLRT